MGASVVPSEKYTLEKSCSAQGFKDLGTTRGYRRVWEGGGLKKIVIEFPANSGGYRHKLGLSMIYFLKEHL